MAVLLAMAAPTIAMAEQEAKTPPPSAVQAVALDDNVTMARFSETLVDRSTPAPVQYSPPPRAEAAAAVDPRTTASLDESSVLVSATVPMMEYDEETYSPPPLASLALAPEASARLLAMTTPPRRSAVQLARGKETLTPPP